MPVVGYEDLYEVSNLGHVKNIRMDKVLSSSLRDTGYNVVTLTKNGKKVTKMVSNLVTGAFLGPKPEGDQVSHFNGDSTDDRLFNLRYESPRFNNLRKIEHNTIRNGSDINTSKLSEQQVIDIRNLYEDGGITQRQLAKKYKVKQSSIWSIVNRRSWSHI